MTKMKMRMMMDY